MVQRRFEDCYDDCIVQLCEVTSQGTKLVHGEQYCARDYRRDRQSKKIPSSVTLGLKSRITQNGRIQNRLFLNFSAFDLSATFWAPCFDSTISSLMTQTSEMLKYSNRS
jgi:hypothetical protein